MKTLTGSRGMAKVEYLGANYGKETYYGPVTGIGYTFSLRAKIRFVDRRDLHTDDKRGLLDLYQGKSPLFRVVTEAVTARSPSKPELPTISDIAESTEDSDMVAFYVAELSAVKGIGEKSAKALVDAGYLNLEHITQASADQLQEDLGWTVSRVSSLKRKVADAV